MWSHTTSDTIGKELHLSELSLFTCKMGTIIIPASQGCCQG